MILLFGGLATELGLPSRDLRFTFQRDYGLGVRRSPTRIEAAAHTISGLTLSFSTASILNSLGASLKSFPSC